MRSLSSDQARRLAITAAGLAGQRPAVTNRSQLRKLVRQTGLIQIDSVNVLTRAHYLPGFSRLGAYPRPLLDRMAYRDRELFEYWGHEAALIPIEHQPLMRWRMERYRAKGHWPGLSRLQAEQPHYIDSVLEELRQRGPCGAGELAAEEKRGGANWGWNWTNAKTALEWLFMVGLVSVHDRVNFERIYDVADRVIPPGVLAMPTPDERDARKELLLIAARSQGVGTVADLADHHRQLATVCKPLIDELVEDGRLEQVEVRGWTKPAYLLPGTVVPRRVDAHSLLVPFDPLIWFRDRIERIWGMRYRIEIYTPKHKRIYGYYVLPFLLGDALVARVDLKADRAGSRLLVQAAWAEPGMPPEAPEALARELELMAEWLDLDGFTVVGVGDLAPALAAFTPDRKSPRRL